MYAVVHGAANGLMLHRAVERVGQYDRIVLVEADAGDVEVCAGGLEFISVWKIMSAPFNARLVAMHGEMHN